MSKRQVLYHDRHPAQQADPCRSGAVLRNRPLEHVFQRADLPERPESSAAPDRAPGNPRDQQSRPDARRQRQGARRYAGIDRPAQVCRHCRVVAAVDADLSVCSEILRQGNHGRFG